MPEVVDPDVLQDGTGANALPEWLKIGQPGAGEGADDHPGVLVDLLDAGQDVDRGLTEMDDFGAGLGVRQAQGSADQIHVFPLEHHDLAKPATGQDQQSGGGDRRCEFDPFVLHLAQDIPDPLEFSRAQKTFPLLLGILLYMLARVRPVRTQPPHLGEAEHLRDHFEAAIGLVGNMPQVVVELCDVGPSDLGDAMSSERGQDRPLDEAAITLRRGFLDPDRDVLLVEALGQFLDRDRFPFGIAFGGGVIAVPRGRNDADGAGARLFAGQDGAGAEAHSAGASSGPVLDDVTLATARQNAETEAGEFVVPDEILGRLNLGGVDHAFGQFRHGPRSALDAHSASRHPLRSPVEALWKQEGESRGVSLRKSECGASRFKSTKSLKIRRKKQIRVFLRNRLPATHKLKVAGRSPA